MGFLRRLVISVGVAAFLAAGWYLVFVGGSVFGIVLSIVLGAVLLFPTLIWLAFGWDYLFDSSLGEPPKAEPEPPPPKPVWDEQKKKWIF